MPPGLLRAYVRMKPAIEASEALHWVDRLAIGTGSVPKESRFDVERLLSSWRSAAMRGSAVVRPATREERLAYARSYGVGVRRVKSKE